MKIRLQTNADAKQTIVLLLIFIAGIFSAHAQQHAEPPIVITGARFAYPLLQRWIDDYNKQYPDVQIIIESRGTTDPGQYQILAEVFEPAPEIKVQREYLFIARYAILPVANSKSAFARTYAAKGLTEELIRQLFFHDLLSDRKKSQISLPYTVYTRLQRAGAPIVFTQYFGFEQKDIKGKTVAGSDEHLLKALLRDSTGITYLPMPLIYDLQSHLPHAGLSILPVDLNDNGRISDNERIYEDLASALEYLERHDPDELRNLPVSFLHLSVVKDLNDKRVTDFLKWVLLYGKDNLHDFGFLSAGKVNESTLQTRLTKP